MLLQWLTSSEVGWEVKDWNKAGKKPSKISSADEASIGIGGMVCFPEIDSVVVKIGWLQVMQLNQQLWLESGEAYFFLLASTPAEWLLADHSCSLTTPYQDCSWMLPMLLLILDGLLT